MIDRDYEGILKGVIFCNMVSKDSTPAEIRKALEWVNKEEDHHVGYLAGIERIKGKPILIQDIVSGKQLYPGGFLIGIKYKFNRTLGKYEAECLECKTWFRLKVSEKIGEGTCPDCKERFEVYFYEHRTREKGED